MRGDQAFEMRLVLHRHDQVAKIDGDRIIETRYWVLRRIPILQDGPVVVGRNELPLVLDLYR